MDFKLTYYHRQDGQVHEPSAKITSLEDKSLKVTTETALKQLSLDHKSPARPAYGTKGRKINLWTNYFELYPDRDFQFFKYDCQFIPESGKKSDEPKGPKRARCLELLMKELPQVPMVSDYGSTILSTQTMGLTEKQYLIKYFAENNDGPDDRSPQYTATVQYTGPLSFETLLTYLESTDMSLEKDDSKQSIIQAMNIMLSHDMKANKSVLMKKTSGSKNKYFPVNRSGPGANLIEQQILNTGLEAFRGYFMSVRAATGRILLNVQVQHAVAWQVMPLTHLLQQLQREKMTPEQITRHISGLYVTVTHLNNRLKKIHGLAMPSDGIGAPDRPQVPYAGADATKVKFSKDGTYITVASYFKTAYGRNVSSIVVNVGSRTSPIYMPSELCNVKQNQDYNRLLSPANTKTMIRFAVRNAPSNAASITGNGLKLLQANSEAKLNQFGVKINPSMLVVDGRVLPTANPKYTGTQQANPRFGSWNMADVQFSRGVNVSDSSWTYLWVKIRKYGQEYGGEVQNLDEVQKCVMACHAVMKKSGVVLGMPRMDAARNPEIGVNHEITINNVQDPGPQLNSFLQAHAKPESKIQLLFVILPENNTAIYNAIKQACDVKYGIHTVIMVAEGKKFAKALQADNSQYFANVALKVNLKLGGYNQLLQPADLGFIGEGKTMLVGLDVTHSAPGSAKGAPSVSAIVASVDRFISQWPADVAIQEGRKEMIVGLKNMFKSRLRLWQKHNQNRLPEEILIYRDGVGESMYDLVRSEEYPPIREACKEIYPANITNDGLPYISIVICGKRHHTRFYPTTDQDAEKSGSPNPGTVVDRGITETRIWDFFLQAHSALQGTAKPCHYVVVHDEIFRRRAAATTKADLQKARTIKEQLAADNLEALTHAMCYMFGRATKAVSLCPPAYYADLVCDRARRWLARVFDERTVVSSESGIEARMEDVTVHPNLKDTMFYI